MLCELQWCRKLEELSLCFWTWLGQVHGWKQQENFLKDWLTTKRLINLFGKKKIQYLLNIGQTILFFLYKGVWIFLYMQKHLEVQNNLNLIFLETTVEGFWMCYNHFMDKAEGINLTFFIWKPFSTCGSAKKLEMLEKKWDKQHIKGWHDWPSRG